MWEEAEDSSEIDEAYEDYSRYILRKWVFMAICLAVIFLVTGYALTVGGYDIGFWETYAIIWDHLTDNITDVNKDYVIINLRAPWIVIGIITGAALAICGAVMQSTLMNPLADPYTTGVSSGAMFGATLASIMGISIFGSTSIVANAFVFSLMPMLVIILVARIKNTSPTVMIMAGIAVMYIFNACTTMIKLWADAESLQEIYQWSVGTLTYAGWDDVPVMLAVVVPGIVALQFLSKKLNVLATGDDSAKSLGINADTLREICMVIVALMAASVVSFTGLIGFVGLVAPHIVRIFIGADNRYLLPASMLFGAALLILADLVGRTIIAPATIQVGVITAFIGGPMFLWIILKRDSRVWG
ncbi:Fe3+-siderophore ABC transporter permease [Candidatus Methanomethylophilus sp. 1R26]|nr:Fe3+-siderophore ABC transporter permease [Candidatus Methanomethylophilus sp. 1R26]